MSKKDHNLTEAELAAWYDMTPEESWAWYESGLSAHGTDLDNWTEEAIIRYGRLLEKKKGEQLEEANAHKALKQHAEAVAFYLMTCAHFAVAGSVMPETTQ